MKNRFLTIGGTEFVRLGRFPVLVRPREEWDTDVTDPEEIVTKLRRARGRADLLTFMQRLPESKPRFGYPMEWDNVAAIPIKSYDHWLWKQLHRNPRNKLRKAEKEGLVVREVAFDDQLIAGIKTIHDEVPIRQGRPFAYYGHDLDRVRRGYETYRDRAVFLGAFFNNELIGFLKLVDAGRYARTMGLLTLVRHRDLAPMNALIAKAVEICAARRYPYLVYGRYDYGKVGSDSVVDFKFYNGFEHIILPRYYIPLSTAGKACLHLRWHHGPTAYFPGAWVQFLRRLKIRYYEWRFRPATPQTAASRTATGPSLAPQP